MAELRSKDLTWYNTEKCLLKLKQDVIHIARQRYTNGGQSAQLVLKRYSGIILQEKTSDFLEKDLYHRLPPRGKFKIRVSFGFFTEDGHQLTTAAGVSVICILQTLIWLSIYAETS